FPYTTLFRSRIRTEAAAMNALMRNLGASIGVAALVALLDRNVQINRSEIAEHLTPFNPHWRFAYVPMQNGVPISRERLIDYWTPLTGGFPFGSVPTDDPNK